MAADVSSLVQILSRYKDDRSALKDSTGPRSTVALMTRDLLGTGGCGGEGGDEQSLELDLDLKVPYGWEKRLDLKVRCYILALILQFRFPEKILKGRNKQTKRFRELYEKLSFFKNEFLCYYCKILIQFDC